MAERLLPFKGADAFVASGLAVGSLRFRRPPESETDVPGWYVHRQIDAADSTEPDGPVVAHLVLDPDVDRVGDPLGAVADARRRAASEGA